MTCVCLNNLIVKSLLDIVCVDSLPWSDGATSKGEGNSWTGKSTDITAQDQILILLQTRKG